MGFGSVSRRAVGGLAVLVAGAFGLTAASVSGARVTDPTLSVSKHVAGLPAVVWGRSIRLFGHESLRGSQKYVLQAAAFPFTSGFHTVATGTTTGNYSISVRPSHATRYRVVVGGSTSRVATVYVLDRGLKLGCNLCSRGHHPGFGAYTLIIRARIEIPPGPFAAPGPIYLYYAQVRGVHRPRTMRLVNTAPPQISGHSLSYTVKHRLYFARPSTYRWIWLACQRDHESMDGLGLPGHHHCGNATINGRSRYLG